MIQKRGTQNGINNPYFNNPYYNDCWFDCAKAHVRRWHLFDMNYYRENENVIFFFCFEVIFIPFHQVKISFFSPPTRNKVDSGFFCFMCSDRDKSWPIFIGKSQNKSVKTYSGHCISHFNPHQTVRTPSLTTSLLQGTEGNRKAEAACFEVPRRLWGGGKDDDCFWENMLRALLQFEKRPVKYR